MKDTHPESEKIAEKSREIAGKQAEAFDDEGTSRRLERKEMVDGGRREVREAMESRKMIAEGVNRDLHKSYDRYLTPEKRNLNVAERTHFVESEEFKKRLLRKTPNLTDREMRSTHGFYDGEEQKILINSDASRSHTSRVAAHEGTHMMSASGFRDKYGERANEGMTEHFSRESTRPVEVHDLEFRFDKRNRRLKDIKDVTPHYYDEEVRVSSMISQHARAGGEGTLERAYFRGGGDVDRLSEAVDRSTGRKGTLDSVSRHLEAAHRYRRNNEPADAEKEYQKCFDILKSKGKID